MADDERTATSGANPPPDPRADRQAAMVRALQVAVVVVLVLAVGALVAPPAWRAALADAMVVALIAVPTLRVAWLAARWAGRRDWRYVAAAVALLGVLAVGVLVR